LNFEEEYIKQTFTFLGHEKETNIRIIDPKGIQPVQNYFVKNENQFLQVCKTYAGKYNIYAGINERSTQGTTSREVISVKTIVIDLDPVRINAPLDKKDASTEEELKETEKVADNIIKDIIEMGFNAPIKCLSGNGVQLWFSFPKIEINDTNRQEIENKVKLFINNIKMKYETKQIKIDQIGDLARVIKVMGTLSIKGNNTTERPYRLAKPLETFERKEDTKFLEELLKLQPKQTTPELTERKVKLSTWEILKLKNPTSAERGSLIMQLKEGNNWNEQQIIEYIAKNNKWENYDPIKTREGIETFFKSYADKPNPRKQKQENEQGYFGITETNKKAKFELIKCLGYGYQRKTEGYTINPEIHYKLFEITFGTGVNKKFYVISKPFEQKALGTNETCLRKLLFNTNEEGQEKLEDISYCYPEKNILLAICKEQKINTKIIVDEEKGTTREATYEELLQKVIEKHKEEEIFYKETSTIAKKKIQNFTNNQWGQVLCDYINEGINKDPLITLIYKSDLIQPNPEKLIHARLYQPKNSHELVFTNSKTTKTSTAQKTGKLLNSARLSNLLGFATANEKIEGSLNNETQQITIDELQEDNGEELFSLLSNYLEFGEAETRKGKAIVKVRGFAGMRFQGNPKINLETEKQNKNNNLNDWEDKEKLYQHFVDCLRIISRNNEAFGGRIALIVFRTDLISKEEFETENSLSLKELEINEAIVKTILNEARNNFSDLYYDQTITNWLNKPCSKEYKETLEQIEEEAPLQPIKDFIKGHRELANSHLRGKAFKLACVDYALDLMNNTLNKEELLNKAEKYVNQIETENINSLSNLIGVSKNEKTQAVFIKTAFEGLPEHLKIMLNALVKYLQLNNENNKPNFDQVSLYFNLPEYWTKQKVKERATKNMTKTNNNLKKFGVCFEGDQNEPYFYLQNKKLLEYLEIKEVES
jgi:hypothetical protein